MQSISVEVIRSVREGFVINAVAHINRCKDMLLVHPSQQSTYSKQMNWCDSVGDISVTEIVNINNIWLIMAF